MRKTALTLTLLVTAFTCAQHTDVAQAQPTRVFVAAQGSAGEEAEVEMRPYLSAWSAGAKRATALAASLVILTTA